VLTRAFRDGKFSSWDDSAYAGLQKLGVTDIWFTGIPRHASGEDFVKGDTGSPYAICNWYDVNPYLADNPEDRVEEFKALVKRTHEAGFKVITDFIPNHVACNYQDTEGGIPVTGFCDYDWTDTLKIDYSRPEAVEAMKNVALYWASLGVDGLRCDMAEMVDPEILGQISRVLKAYRPDFLMLAEVYDRNNYRKYIHTAGFDLLYDKSGIYDILKSINLYGGSARQLTWNWQSLGDLQPQMLNFLENHDEVRIASDAYLGSAEKAFPSMAAAALFSNASLMIYSGQECGEKAEESSDGRTSIFNRTRIKSLDKPDRKILSRYREILKLASGELCSSGTNWDLCYCNDGIPPREGYIAFDADKHFCFLRHYRNRTLLVFCNFSDSSGKVEVNVPEDAAKLFGTECGLYDIEISNFNFSYKYL